MKDILKRKYTTRSKDIQEILNKKRLVINNQGKFSNIINNLDKKFKENDKNDKDNQITNIDLQDNKIISKKNINPLCSPDRAHTLTYVVT